MADLFAMLRWNIPIDDSDHEIIVSARDDIATQVEAGGEWHETLTFWTIPSSVRPRARHFRVFGTGQPIPQGYTYRGTAPRTPDGLLWHLFERILP